MDIGKQPYVFYLISLISGIFLYPFISVSGIFLSIVLVSLLIFLIFIVFKIQFRNLFSVVLLLCWGILGILLVDMNTGIPENHFTHFEEKGIQYISVIPEEQNNSNEKYRKYTAEVQGISYEGKVITSSGKVMLLLDKNKFDSVLVLGNGYKLAIRLQDPSGALNPHQFDYKKYLERNYILRMGIVTKVISQEPHTSLLYKIKNFNQLLSGKIDESTLNSYSREFLKAFLLGDRAEMKKDNVEAYSRAGIMHLIAISGMHVAFIFGLIFSVLSFILGRKNKNAVIIGSLVFVWLFGCFVGLESSVFRSCLMITIYYIFELLRRPSDIYHSLSLSAIIILLYNPYEIYSIGFQLSYIAVFFMSWLSPVLVRRMKTGNKKLTQWIIEPLCITLAAQLGTLPFVLFYFHQFSLLSVPANILIIPYTAVITYSSLIELSVVLLPENFQIYFSVLYDFLIKLLIDGTYWVSSAGLFMVRFVSLNLLELVLLTSAIILTKYYFNEPRLKNAIPFLVCLVIFQFSRLLADYKSSHKENLIVFANKHPLLGIREGKSLLVLKDKNDDEKKLNSYIIEPYITGENIKQVRYITIDYQEIYNWKSRYIGIISGKESNHIPEPVDFLIVSGSRKIDFAGKNIGNIIITGNMYLYNNQGDFEEDSKSKIWKTGEKGFFIMDY